MTSNKEYTKRNKYTYIGNKKLQTRIILSSMSADVDKIIQKYPHNNINKHFLREYVAITMGLMFSVYPFNPIILQIYLIFIDNVPRDRYIVI